MRGRPCRLCRRDHGHGPAIAGRGTRKSPRGGPAGRAARRAPVRRRRRRAAGAPDGPGGARLPTPPAARGGRRRGRGDASRARPPRTPGLRGPGDHAGSPGMGRRRAAVPDGLERVSVGSDRRRLRTAQPGRAAALPGVGGAQAGRRGRAGHPGGAAAPAAAVAALDAHRPSRARSATASARAATGFTPASTSRPRPGAAVHAARGGRVAFAGWNSGGYGRLIIIDHGSGVTTWYAHLSRLDVAAGRQVAAGALIGRVGATGYATGPHLHFEVRVRDAATDPLDGSGLTLPRSLWPCGGRGSAWSCSSVWRRRRRRARRSRAPTGACSSPVAATWTPSCPTGPRCSR